MTRPKVAALIMAAGRGQRLGADAPKQYLLLGERTVLSRSLALFAGHPQVDRVHAVIHADDHARYTAATASSPSPRRSTAGPRGRSRSAAASSIWHSIRPTSSSSMTPPGR